MTSYSQKNQDIKILKLLNFKQNGYFLDIGCAHFKDISNTYALEKDFGWTGLCVDPRKGLKPEFERKRKCSFKETAIYTHTGKIMFRDTGVLSGVADDTVTDECKRPATFYEVSCTTLEDLFLEFNVPTTIDYMSLDVEGAELLILETFPFSKHTLLTISVEHNSHKGPKQKQKAQKILKLMSDNNFELVDVASMDYIFMNKKLLR